MIRRAQKMRRSEDFNSYLYSISEKISEKEKNPERRKEVFCIKQNAFFLCQFIAKILVLQFGKPWILHRFNIPMRMILQRTVKMKENLETK